MKGRALALGVSAALWGLAYAGISHIKVLAQDERLSRIFGDVRDVNGYMPLEGARIQVRVKGTAPAMIAITDAEGRFKFQDVPANVDPDALKITCSLEGYRLLNLARRKLRTNVDAPIQVECLLEKE
ncbi:carboxypeptidase-like regulatory domain-containing protein [Roseiarcaceae bacterium H3SJ34-1]|uniref:carboxypeptidase-like regulatory domain-containing protein n=1 Tax=Terripilifer ovatus TaxID=3032367 RepID=UPI003AB92EDB|nr:carboxypeptidase-like regulatory domain-containing protein [Roseiarcaceae bacterium H3SJ34-1]